MSPRTMAARTFRSMRVRNYRLYFWGEVVSLSGKWLQVVALSWLVLQLTGSPLHVGLVVAAEFAPMLVLGPLGGVLADRVDKRRMLVVTSAASGTLALALGALVITGAAELWTVYAVSLGFGLVNLIDMPVRSAFMAELVGREHVANATSLNGVVMNASRVVGPAAAGVLIATVGLGWCFVFNGVTYAGTIAALMRMRRSELRTAPPVARARGQLREGLRYVFSTPELRMPLLVMTIVGTFAFNFSIVLPLLAHDAFAGGPGTFSAMFSMFGLGAVIGGLGFAAYGRSSERLVAGVALGFGALIWAAALAPSFEVELAVLVLVGAAGSAFIAASSSMLQLSARVEMRGRVMSLFTTVFVGSTPIGGPLVGWIAEHWGARASLAMGASATLLAGAWGMYTLRGRKLRSRRAPEGTPADVAVAVESAA